MGVSLIPQAQDVVSKAQAALADINATMEAVGAAPRTVNQQPVTSPAPAATPLGGGFVQELQQAVAGIKGQLSDLHKAGELQTALPLFVFILGILVGKPVLGAVLAAVLYLASMDSTAAPANG